MNAMLITESWAGRRETPVVAAALYVLAGGHVTPNDAIVSGLVVAIPVSCAATFAERARGK